MTIAEKNIREWIEELGLKEKIMEEGKKEVARKMLKKGVPIGDIMDCTDLSRDEILKLQDAGE